MPLYIFTCLVCNEKEELLQKFMEPAPIACMSCGAADSMLRDLSKLQKGGGNACVSPYIRSKK